MREGLLLTDSGELTKLQVGEIWCSSNLHIFNLSASVFTQMIFGDVCVSVMVPALTGAWLRLTRSYLVAQVLYID